MAYLDSMLAKGGAAVAARRGQPGRPVVPARATLLGPRPPIVPERSPESLSLPGADWRGGWTTSLPRGARW